MPPVDYVRKIDDISIVNTFSAEYTGEQTNVNIITPSSGKKIEIFSVLMHGEGSSGTASLDFLTSGIAVARLYFAKSGQIYTSRVKIVGGVNEPLTLNISGVLSSEKTFIVVSYREV